MQKAICDAYHFRLIAAERWSPPLQIQRCLSKTKILNLLQKRIMFLTVSTCALALFSTQILSAYSSLRREILRSSVAFSPLALINKELATIGHKKPKTPLPTPLQALEDLGGYLIIQIYADRTCTDMVDVSSQELNYCMDVSYGARKKSYQFITATATSANATEYKDSACTIPVRYAEGFHDERYTLSDNCILENSTYGGSVKYYRSASFDVATTRAIFNTK